VARQNAWYEGHDRRMNATPRQTTVKRRQRIGIIWLLSAVLTLAAAYTGYRLYLAHKVKVKIGQIRQAGFPVTTAELNQWYPAVPPEKNAAFTLTNAFGHLVNVNTNTPNLPIIGRGKLPPPNDPLPPEMRQAIAEYVATNQVALELLERGLALKSCRYPVDFTPGWDALLPHLAGLRKSAQLLALKALSDIDNDEPSDAAKALQSMLTLADTVAKEPLLISHLVRMACYQLSYQCLERALCNMTLDHDSLLHLSSIYHDMETSDGLQRSLVAERCVALQSFSGSFKEIERLLEGGGESDSHGFGVAFGFWIIQVSGRWDFDELYYLDCMERYSQAIQLILPERIDAAEEVSDQIQAMKGSKYPHVLSGLFLPAIGKSIQKDAGNISRLRAARTVLAIELYRLANHRQLPSTLNELVPEVLMAVPADPFDGEPLRYRRLDKGYVVYSVGPDGEDNGGAEEKRLSNAQRLAGISESSDITFTVER
jgi:hypothetical protein